VPTYHLHKRGLTRKQTGSGALLASFDAHYRGVTCLVWTQDDDGAFFSGSEDASVHCWSLASCVLVRLAIAFADERRLVSLSQDDLGNPTPYASLRDHTLPITDIAVGCGRFPRVRCLTSSVDGSCKVRRQPGSTPAPAYM
jgi:pre-rRNA-processing protein IPI3